jgi:hypothetical protein
MALALAAVLAADRAPQDSTQPQIQPVESEVLLEYSDLGQALAQAEAGAVQQEAPAEVREAVVEDQAAERIFGVAVAAVVVAEAVAEAKAGPKAPQLFTARNALRANAPIKSTSASTISTATQLSMPGPIRSPVKIHPKFLHGTSASAAMSAARSASRISTTAVIRPSST